MKNQKKDSDNKREEIDVKKKQRYNKEGQSNPKFYDKVNKVEKVWTRF